jgi:uncharacterized protein YbjQ (UPF0145 family)
MGEEEERTLERMVDDVRGLGADAIVVTRFQTSVVMAGAAEFRAFGTAVVLDEEGN